MTGGKPYAWILSITIAVALAALATVRLAQKDAQPSDTGRVKRVVSGDTIKLKGDQKLVYLGIRSPNKSEPLYDRAKQRNAELVAGKKIKLVYEGIKRDKKYRLLAYAFLKDGTFVNRELVKEGLASVKLSPHIKQFREVLLAAEEEARQQRRGIWATEVRSGQLPASP
jgi:micrococcal nuclease